MIERPPKQVYFLRADVGRPMIKIGCTRWPDARLRNFQRWSPAPLSLAASIVGDHKLERRFHAAFLAEHSHQEWFFGSPRLLAAIEMIRAGNFDTARLPKGVNLYQPPRAAA